MPSPDGRVRRPGGSRRAPGHTSFGVAASSLSTVASMTVSIGGWADCRSSRSTSIPTRRDRRLQGGDHVGPERGGLAVALIEGEPRHRPVVRSRRGEPRGEQCGLSEPGRRRDQGQPGLRRMAQAPAQSRAGDHTSPEPGNEQLCFHQGVCQSSSLVGSRGGDAHEGRACNRTSAGFLLCSGRWRLPPHRGYDDMARRFCEAMGCNSLTIPSPISL